MGELRKASLARITCDNGNSIQYMQRHAFRILSHSNPRKSCKSEHIPKMNLRPWIEGLCKDGWKYFNNRCYYFSGNRKSVTWNGAESECKKLHPQANLVSIISKEEQEFISSNTGNALT